ncbi:sulfotransferase domain-containing protein [Colwellia sp. UCD-KL20]|uniref:sulfotransferase domain-containing protein n=1 Tax=Colwellia sp. UCD-KL20 TaxID=1917165 RepID=UPI000970CA7D|nr:sulfotransferase domain-containing protein [Colwellia sp. UCD-KL20]
MKFFIIGGTEKAGTTSLYEYFTNHPEIISSHKKETDYFRGDSCNLENYLTCFNDSANESQTYMEASPGYLGLSNVVAKEIKNVVPNAKLVFMVRDPINRLRSSYLFHRSKLYIPEDMDINQYVKYCLDYENGLIKLEDTPFTNPWFLNVLQAGSYKKHIEVYKDNFDNNIQIINFEYFCKNTLEVVVNIAKFLEIDANYFDGYEFFTANKTFQSSNHFIHKISMFMNNKLEPILRKRPNLKRKIVDLYQKVNTVDKIDGGDYSEETISRLKEFYKDDALWLKEYFSNTPQSLSWKNFNEK